MKKLFLISLLATVVIAVILGKMGAPLVHDGAPGGVLSFELAWTEGSLARIMAPWDEATVARAVTVNLIDYLFLVCYGTFFASASLLLGRWAGRIGRSGIAKWGVWGFRLSVMAAVLDGVENGFGFPILLAGRTAPWVQLMSLAATIKFAALAIVLIFLLVGLVVTAAARSVR